MGLIRIYFTGLLYRLNITHEVLSTGPGSPTTFALLNLTVNSHTWPYPSTSNISQNLIPLFWWRTNWENSTGVYHFLLLPTFSKGLKQTLTLKKHTIYSHTERGVLYLNWIFLMKIFFSNEKFRKCLIGQIIWHQNCPRKS